MAALMTSVGSVKPVLLCLRINNLEMMRVERDWIESNCIVMSERFSVKHKDGLVGTVRESQIELAQSC